MSDETVDEIIEEKEKEIMRKKPAVLMILERRQLGGGSGYACDG